MFENLKPSQGQSCEELLQASFRYALSLTHNRHDAEDLAQQAWLNLSRKHGRIRSLSLLFRTVRNLFYDAWRRGRIVVFETLEEPDEVPDKPSGMPSVQGDLDTLLAQLSRIDFSILPPGDFLAHDHNLEGGRYCSLQSELAAQLELRQKGSGDPCILYVVALSPELRKVKPDTRVIDGVRVQVWVDNDRLFALARNATSHNPSAR